LSELADMVKGCRKRCLLPFETSSTPEGNEVASSQARADGWTFLLSPTVRHPCRCHLR